MVDNSIHKLQKLDEDQGKYKKLFKSQCFIVMRIRFHNYQWNIIYLRTDVKNI